MNEIKRTAVLIEDHYQVLEAWYPFFRLQEAGFEPVFLGTGRQCKYSSKEGYLVSEGVAVSKADADDFNGVIIPGGYAPDLLRRDQRINRFVRTLHENGCLVAAICHGGWVLVSAGILQSKKATSFHSIKDDMVNAGAQWVDQEVVVDGNLVTSRTPQDLPAFSIACLEYLSS